MWEIKWLRPCVFGLAWALGWHCWEHRIAIFLCIVVSIDDQGNDATNRRLHSWSTIRCPFSFAFVIPISDSISTLPYSCSGKESDHANHGHDYCGFSQQKSGCCVQSRALRVSTTPLNELMPANPMYTPRHRTQMVSVTLMLLCPWLVNASEWIVRVSIEDHTIFVLEDARPWANWKATLCTKDRIISHTHQSMVWLCVLEDVVGHQE